MVEEKPTVKERFSNIVQKAKGYPKILISLLTICSVGLGFVAGMATNRQSQQSLYQGDRSFPDGKVGQRPSFKSGGRSNANPAPTDEDSDTTSGASESSNSQESTSQ